MSVYSWRTSLNTLCQRSWANVIASDSSRSISTAPDGKDTPSRKYRSAPQSNSTNSICRRADINAARITFTASGVTSFPIPSPGITAILAAAPPLRIGIPAKTIPPRQKPPPILLAEQFFPHCQRLNPIHARLKTDPCARRHRNRTARRDYPFRFHTAFGPVSLARSHISRQDEVWERGECDIVSAANPGLQHSAAPNRHPVRLAQVVNSPRNRMPADPAHLDIDDPARAQLNRGPRLLFRVNALVEANRRLQFLLEFHMPIQVVPTQRLLDHHQIEVFQFL